PAGAADRVGPARLCAIETLDAAAVRFWESAIAADPSLADDVEQWNRYNAACAAAVAGCGRGRDAEGSSEPARAELRRRAEEWLRADLAHVRRRIELAAGDRKALDDAARILDHWTSDPDLAGVRDEPALASFAEDERHAWRAFWAEVRALLDVARGS